MKKENYNDIIYAITELGIREGVEKLVGTDMIHDLRFQSLQMMDELSVTICIMHLC